MNLRTFLCAAAMIPMAMSLGAQEVPQLVKNINTAGNGVDLDADAVEFKGLVYFAAEDDVEGEELWVTDGTEEGTEQVMDIHVGPSSSFPEQFTIAGDTLFFVADQDSTGAELWKSDGTEAGTMLVEDIIPGSDDASLSELTAFQGQLYFRATTSGEGEELWRSDGTEAGTDLFEDINVGTGDSAPDELTALDDFLLFSADGGTDGSELWRTDGTPAGTVQVKNIASGSDSSAPDDLTRVGNRVYFRAATAAEGDEPWVTDGTNEGTQPLGDLNTGGDSFASNFVGLDSLVYFQAFDGVETRLYETDGTAGGTALVRDESDGEDPVSLDHLVVSGDLLFFEAEDSDGLFGDEVWKSDGTVDGTVMVRDINTGTDSSFPRDLTPVGDNHIFFVAESDDEGEEPWVSDGTKDGTRLLADLREGTDGSDPQPHVASQGRVFFSADEGTGLNDELYVVAVFPPTFRNISTRGFVGLGDRVLIGGFIIGGSPKRVIVRAIGPSLGAFGIGTPLFNPRVQIFSGQEMIASNDNWRDTQEAEIIDTGLAPGHDNESAIVIQLNPGPYTAIVSSPGGGTGVGLVEVFELGPAEAPEAGSDPPQPDVGF